MNKIFKKVWNRRRGCFVAVSEAMTAASQNAGKAAVVTAGRHTPFTNISMPVNRRQAKILTMQNRIIH